ncbi:MAG: very short patch repair endonuclease [Candidatus Methanomethylophilus sp.]|nr:very short patch repair endonuclease [Methanomethylophilus sp.]MDD4431784.1 very short patch repair endonuclease [Bacteroidales bacterium]
MDNHTPEQRHRNMQAIRSKDTGIEIMLRQELWNRGLHYRKYYCKVPGHPDIAFPKKKVAVFCDAEFWHGYDWKNQKDHIQTRREFWIPKIEHNIEHDAKIDTELASMSWTVIRFWGREIKHSLPQCAEIVETVLWIKPKDRAAYLTTKSSQCRFNISR